MAAMAVARAAASRGARRAGAVLGLAAAIVVLPAAPALAHNQLQPQPRWPDVLWAWQFDPPVVTGLALAAVAYLYGVRLVALRHPRNPWRPGRTRCFMAGLLVLTLALESPIGTYDGTLFSVHMVQHQLLTMVAAPLLVLGTPVSLLVRAVGRRGHRRVLALLHSPPVTLLTHPLLGWLGFAAVMVGSHFSRLYEAALESNTVHLAEHGLYLGAALLFWWPVAGLDPSRWRLPHPLRLGYVFLQGPVNTFVALALYSSGRVLYPHYALRTWGPSALDDQHLGGAIMWVAGDLLFLAALGLTIAAWMRHEDIVTARVDAELAALRAARGVRGDGSAPSENRARGGSAGQAAPGVDGRPLHG
jgi:putative membrane protein